MVEHELRLRQQQQQQRQQRNQQQQQLQPPRQRHSQATQHGPMPAPQQVQQQQQYDPPTAESEQQQQQRLLQQKLALEHLLRQQKQRKRQLQLQVRREPAVLTQLIKHSTSWQRLSQLFSNLTPLFNPIHVSAAITHLAQLQQQPLAYQSTAKDSNTLALQQFVQDLTAAAVACIPDFGPRQIANSLWAINRLGCGSLVTRKLRNTFLEAFVEKLQYAAPQHVSMIAAAVANLGWASSTTWRSAILSVSAVCAGAGTQGSGRACVLTDRVKSGRCWCCYLLLLLECVCVCVWKQACSCAGCIQTECVCCPRLLSLVSCAWRTCSSEANTP